MLAAQATVQPPKREAQKSEAAHNFLCNKFQPIAFIPVILTKEIMGGNHDHG